MATDEVVVRLVRPEDVVALQANCFTQNTVELGIDILETSARGGEPAKEVYRRLGFREWGRVPGGMHQSWGKGQNVRRGVLLPSRHGVTVTESIAQNNGDDDGSWMNLLRFQRNGKR